MLQNTVRWQLIITYFINIISPSVKKWGVFIIVLEVQNRITSSVRLFLVKIPGQHRARHGELRALYITEFSSSSQKTTRVQSPGLRSADWSQSLASMNYHHTGVPLSSSQWGLNVNMWSLLGHSDQTQIMASSKPKCLEELNSKWQANIPQVPIPLRSSRKMRKTP